MATIQFLDPSTQTDFSASGIGFFGVSYGASVLVGNYQTTSFVTDGNGSVNIMQLPNVQYLNAQSGVVGSSTSGINVKSIPNFQTTCNLRFTHTSSVRTQNGELRIYDRTNINNPASGVTTKIYETIHPNQSQFGTGSGNATWTGSTTNPQTGTATVGGSGLTHVLTASPGVSGFRPNGAGTTSVQHDWYIALSASPDSVGSKTLYGLYASLEYF